MTWTAVSRGVSLDPSGGKFTRSGVALFKNGDVALPAIEGQLTARDGSSFAVKLTYKFEDGSTFVHQGKGEAVQKDGKTLLQAAT
jgi:hypothetical protein